MATSPLFRYPLDATGTNPNNLVVGEPHTLQNRTIRVIAPTYGAFYSESVIIKDLNTNTNLLTTQYKATELYEFPTGRYGKEICGVILITDINVSNNVEITYQALGGDYSTNADAVANMLLTLDLDNRPVSWPNIFSKPSEFVPAMHYHDIGDVYGFEYLVHAMERVRTALIAGDAVAHDEIFRYIDQWGAALSAGGGNTNTQLSAHIANVSNPHSTTKAQVGLSSVDNFATATTPEAQAGAANNKFMTPLTTASAINKIAGDALTAHANNFNNSHQVTKAQVGLGSVDNFRTATTPEAQAGIFTSGFMTPALTAAAITTQAGALVTAHTNRTDNPHSVTATQLGLGNVQNLPLATTQQAQAGAINTAYMTPALTASAVAQFRDNGLLDTRYVPFNQNVSASVRESAGQLHAFIGGAWRIVWPPQWQ